MKRLVFTAVIGAVTVLVGIPAAWSFQPGERVTVGSVNQSGVVLEENGDLVKVRLDSQSGYSAGVGVWYDKNEHKVTGGAGGGTAIPGDASNSGAPSNAGSSSTAAGSGKRVQIGNQSGTILEEKGDLVKVRLDSHSGYGAGVGVWYTREQLNGSANASNVAPSPHTGTPGGISTSSPWLSPGNQKPSPPNQAHQNPQTTLDPAVTEKGIGAPPDGIYTCNKISGRSYIHIGTIEIRGRTYKGFSSQQGSFHPYSLSASGDITWTGGLTSLPTGWTLKPGKYVGPDYKGHPRIRVYYSSDRGAAEVIDATKEN